MIPSALSMVAEMDRGTALNEDSGQFTEPTSTELVLTLIPEDS